jgi:hypothetical protein
MEKKPNKTGAIIATVAAILLCGCPGLSLCVIGVWAATGSMPDSFQLFSSYGNLPGWLGFALLCVALIFILIAILVPVLTLRNKKSTPEVPPIDTLPPTS